jgi:hypothetical protein
VKQLKVELENAFDLWQLTYAETLNIHTYVLYTPHTGVGQLSRVTHPEPDPRRIIVNTCHMIMDRNALSTHTIPHTSCIVKYSM